VAVATAHALQPSSTDPFPVGQRLALIEKGKVPCLHGDNGKAGQCAFRTGSPASGHWLEDKQGSRFAQVGQVLTKDDKRDGLYVVAARVRDGAVPCVGASTGARTRDVAGTLQSTELFGACVVETPNSSTNVSGQPLKNYATIPICTTSNPHPDGAQLHSSDPAAGIYCYIGEGAPIRTGARSIWELPVGQYILSYDLEQWL